MQIFYLLKFRRQFKKIPEELRILAKKRITIFIENLFDPCLKTHKLHGSLADFYAFSVDSKIRIVFEFVNKNTIHFHSIGDHGIYD